MSVDLSPEMTQHEILARIARQLPVRSFLEIGVRDGCTMWVVQEASIQTIRLMALADTWGDTHGGNGRGSHDHIDRLLSAICYYHNGGDVIWLDGDSRETLPELREQRPDLRFDLVHVDGEHSEEAALSDLTNGWAMCEGAMVAHDCRVGRVRRAINTFSAEHGVEAEFYDGGHGTCLWWRSG